MLHTPERPSDVPKARLGAVTRKRNEITELLRDLPRNRDLVAQLYTEYLTKVDAFIEACGNNPDYLEEKMP